MALKKLKIENEKEGFLITSLREINILMKAKHPNIVHVRVNICKILTRYMCIQAQCNRSLNIE